MNLLILQPEPADPPGPLAEWLRDAGAQVDIRNAGELPDDLDGVDALIVLGGAMGAMDDHQHPWLAELRRLLRDAVSSEVPTLGICLGAQLLAAANGGRVGPNPQGPEVGAQLIAKRAAAANDPLFGPLPITPDVIQWHSDAVTQLPPGALLLANSPGCDVQAFRLGRLAWGIQFHIETTPDVVRQWAADDPAAVEGYDVDALLARSDAVHDELPEVWQPFAAAFVGIAKDPGAVAPPPTVRISVAEPVTDPAAIRAALAAELSAARGPVPVSLQPPPRDDSTPARDEGS